MAVKQTSGSYYDNLLNGNNKRGANNRIIDVVENNNNNKSKLLKLWTDNVRELFALKCNGNNRKYNKWITSAIFVILLVPVYGDINSRINNGMLISQFYDFIVIQYY